MSAKQVETFNKFVVSFFNDNSCDESVVESWSSEDNQAALKKVVTKFVSKSERKKKDPAAPKRAKSAYMFFCDAERAHVKEENPDMKATEVTSELGSRWNALKEKGETALKPYANLANQDRERFETEKAAYVPSEDVEESGGRRKRAKKDPLAPKRAKSAYMFFCDAERARVKEENPDMKATEVTAELGSRWNALKEEGEDAMRPYTELAEQDRERFASEKAVYESGSVSDEKPKKTRGKKSTETKSVPAPVATPAQKSKSSSKPTKVAESKPVKSKSKKEEELLEEEEEVVVAPRSKTVAAKTVAAKPTASKVSKNKTR
jgi:uncharacterized protein (DUF736 family)